MIITIYGHMCYKKTLSAGGAIVGRGSGMAATAVSPSCDRMLHMRSPSQRDPLPIFLPANQAEGHFTLTSTEITFTSGGAAIRVLGVGGLGFSVGVTDSDPVSRLS